MIAPSPSRTTGPRLWDRSAADYLRDIAPGLSLFCEDALRLERWDALSARIVEAIEARHGTGPFPVALVALLGVGVRPAATGRPPRGPGR